MGKRIPGKKHKGVKDPLLQIAKKEESLKHVINAPPKEIDNQEIPKSLTNLMKLKEMTKKGVFTKKKKRTKNKTKVITTTKYMGKEKILPGMTKPDRNLPVLTQGSKESNRNFLNRVHVATEDFIKEVTFEAKHNMKMKKDAKTGKVTFDKIEMDPVDQMFHDKLLEKQSHQLKSKRKVIGKESLSKTARRRLRKKEKMEHLGESEDKNKKEMSFEMLRDDVAFNEVVHRPPQLTALPRRATILPAEARRPGNKPGLLLAQIFASGAGEKRDLTIKRKDLSMSDRRRLDSAQATAIQAYRQLKASKTKAVT